MFVLMLLAFSLMVALWNYVVVIRKLQKEIKRQQRQYLEGEWAIHKQTHQYQKARKKVSLHLQRLANPPDSTS